MVKKKSTKSIPQSNKPIVALSKDRQWYDYMSDNSLIHFPEKNDFRNRVIFSLYEWFDNPDSLEIMQFCIEYKIKYTTLQEWRSRFPEIQEAWQDVKRMIACRRKVGAMKRKLDGTYAYRDMHLYDPEWKEVDQYHKELKTDENIKDKKVIIELHDLTKPEEKLEDDASRNDNKAE